MGCIWGWQGEHDKAMAWPLSEKGEGAVAWRGWWGAEGGSGDAEGAELGLSPLMEPAWAIVSSLPARCLWKWPQDILF